ncbi:MAG: hypothetical protein ACE15E_01815 [Acidobacteriota bacterium]
MFGTNTLTISHATLDSLRNYSVLIDGTCLVDYYGQQYTGMSSLYSWHFRTVN